MTSTPGYTLYKCDGSSKDCARQEYVSSSDGSATNRWHRRKYVNKDGEAVEYDFCDACNEAFTEIIKATDEAVNKFTRKEEKRA